MVMHGGGTLVWADGRRAQLDCGFLRNLVQTVQVSSALHSLNQLLVVTCTVDD